MSSRNSLRIEFLFHLAFLATGAVLLAFWMARALEATGAPLAVVLVLVGAAVMAFVLVGNHLIERWVLRPVTEIAQSAESIAAGEYSQRVPETGPEEIVSLARALNHLTDQLLQNQDRLAENVRSLDETNQRLNEAQSELVQAEKMASLGRLAAGVAHEIGNPLGAVLGYASLQRRRGMDPELVDGLEREARRIDRIVRDLLEYARPGNAMPEVVDVNSSSRRVVELLRDQGWLRQVEVTFALTDEETRILADGHRLDQILLNLLRNAESAMNGMGRVTIATSRERYSGMPEVAIKRADDPPGINYSHLRRHRTPSVRPPTRIDNGTEVVRITVSDTGPGIPEDNLTMIFDPFFTTKDPGEGTGLGLAIVAGAVAELGGRIEAKSPPGGGAVFDIRIPVVAGER